MIHTFHMSRFTSPSSGPQTTIGKLVSMTVDNPVYYHQQQENDADQSSPPPLFPIYGSSVPLSNGGDGQYSYDISQIGEEQTMLWRNVATLFSKCDEAEKELQSQREQCDGLTRGTNDLYYELEKTKNEITEQIQSNVTTNHKSIVKKLRKYVNKKCETVSYGAFNADNEVFAYIDKLRTDFDGRLKKLETENEELRKELSKCHETYDDDYELFIKRENDMMKQLTSATQMTERLNERLKEYEGILMKQLQNGLNNAEQRQYIIAGDLREEFARAISREVEMESKVSAKLVQTVNDELTDLITRSNEYHTARYYGMVDELKNTREMCDTLKQSIRMVDDELSDTKETVFEIKDDIYSELDRDYYDLKDYVKRKVHHHEKHHHRQQLPNGCGGDNENNESRTPVEEDAPAEAQAQAQPQAQAQAVDEEHIVIDQHTIIVSDDEQFVHT